jgi:hypothetical protein
MPRHQRSVAADLLSYKTRHDPFVHFHSIIDSPTRDENVVGLDTLTADLANVKKTPNLVYITPNLRNDGHDDAVHRWSARGLVSADAFLQQWVPKVLKSKALKKDGMLEVTFDEAELSDDSTACCGATRRQRSRFRAQQPSSERASLRQGSRKDVPPVFLVMLSVAERPRFSAVSTEPDAVAQCDAVFVGKPLARSTASRLENAP